MTKAQENKIEQIRKECVRQLFHGTPKDDYEFKTFEVKKLDYSNEVSLTVETGLKGDEGTMAQICGRHWFHIFIGPRGGIHYYKFRKNGKGGRVNITRLNLLQIVLDEK